jgi:hypothetical protein
VPANERAFSFLPPNQPPFPIVRNTLLAALCALPFSLLSQQDEAPAAFDPGSITGNVQILWQQYSEDSIIGAIVPPDKAGFNAFGNIIYTRGKFSAGIRYESYLSPVLGYPARFRGTGIGYRFARYSQDNLEITIGNFYDQFGNGYIFRSYEERQLGIDNAMDGMMVKFTPVEGLMLKGVYGKQRFDFDSRLINGPGVVRGFDGELFLNDAFAKLAEKKTKITLGGSFISRYQEPDTYEADTLVLLLPGNVAAYGGRVNLQRGKWTLNAEYFEKINDPNADNGFIYRPGRGAMVQAGYSQKGLGITAGGKVFDNMSFRSDRNMKLFDLPINFIPAITQQHTYILVATLYPYATVVNGEISAMGEVFYKIKKGTKLGGEYGTDIAVNFAMANNLDTTGLSGVDKLVQGYNAKFLSFGGEKFVRDFNASVSRKMSDKLHGKYSFYYLEFNTTVSPVTVDFKGIVYANIHVLDMSYKINKKHTLRWELQGLFTEQDKGDWAAALIEYNISPHWFVSVLDQWNFGNPNPDLQVHYLYGRMGYIHGANRIEVGYGKRREGIFCIGGVCRAVPASNGLEIVITSSF